MEKKIDPKVGDIVVITHRALRDRYCIAKITSLTSNMFRADIWDSRNDCWFENARLRSQSAILGLLAADLTPAAAQKTLNDALATYNLKCAQAENKYGEALKATIMGEVL